MSIIGNNLNIIDEYFFECNLIGKISYIKADLMNTGKYNHESSDPDEFPDITVEGKDITLKLPRKLVPVRLTSENNSDTIKMFLNLKFKGDDRTLGRYILEECCTFQVKDLEDINTNSGAATLKLDLVMHSSKIYDLFKPMQKYLDEHDIDIQLFSYSIDKILTKPRVEECYTLLTHRVYLESGEF